MEELRSHKLHHQNERKKAPKKSFSKDRQRVEGPRGTCRPDSAWAQRVKDGGKQGRVSRQDTLLDMYNRWEG